MKAAKIRIEFEKRREGQRIIKLRNEGESMAQNVTMEFNPPEIKWNIRGMSVDEEDDTIMLGDLNPNELIEVPIEIRNEVSQGNVLSKICNSLPGRIEVIITWGDEDGSSAGNIHTASLVL